MARTIRTAILSVAVVIGIAGCMSNTVHKEEAKKPEKNYIFFPAAPDEPRVQFLCNIHSSKDVEPAASGFTKFVLGEDPVEAKTVQKPFGIAFHNNKLYVADTTDLCIAVFDYKNHKFSRFGMSGPGTLKKPINLRFDSTGRLYVTDTIRKQVLVYDENGNYLDAYGKPGDFQPADIIVTDDTLYVLDVTAHVIKAYDKKTRELIRTIGSRGNKPGEFNYPSNMYMGANGNIYVSDSVNFRVQEVDPLGKPMLVFGGPGRTAGHFARPRGITVDRNGIVYVVDSITHVVQMFSPKGEPLMFFGGGGMEDGQLCLPAQVIVDYDHVDLFRKYIAPDFDAEYLILVTNQLGNNKVSVFAFGKRAGASESEAE